jgi:hypothetical protein
MCVEMQPQAAMSARARWSIVAIIAFAVGLSWLVRFGCDDAWISFHYARGLARGDGLTWFGSHVEGYTNFLWVLWIAIGVAVRADPLVWAWVGSLAALACTASVVAQIVWLRTRRESAAIVAVVLLATNFTFIAFGTSGLETMMQAALLAALWWQVEVLRRGVEPTVKRLALASITSAFALMVRLDSTIFVAPLAGVLALELVRKRATVRAWLACVGPAVLIVGSWLAWKLGYYGDVIPNTAHAKLAWSTDTLRGGVRYLAKFAWAYQLWLPLLVAIVIAVVRRRIESGLAATLATVWCAYVVAVGGDFMEFRFLVVALVPIATIVAGVLTEPATRGPRVELRAAASVAVLAALSWHHAATFESDADCDTIQDMASFYGKIADNDWSRLGGPLRRLAGTGATLASQSAGAIPYFSDLPTVDQLGLDDAWIARHGDPAPPDMRRPGHQRYAPLSYLIERRVSFVIAAAQLVPHGSLPSLTRAYLVAWITESFATPVSLTGPFDVVAVPLDHGADLLLWYLTPTPAIDARLAELGWARRRIDP